MDRRRGKGPRRGLYPELSPSSVSRFRFFPRVNLCRSSCSLTLFLALSRPVCKWISPTEGGHLVAAKDMSAEAARRRWGESKQ